MKPHFNIQLVQNINSRSRIDRYKFKLIHWYLVIIVGIWEPLSAVFLIKSRVLGGTTLFTGPGDGLALIPWSWRCETICTLLPATWQVWSATSGDCHNRVFQFVCCVISINWAVLLGCGLPTKSNREFIGVRLQGHHFVTNAFMFKSVLVRWWTEG